MKKKTLKKYLVNGSVALMGLSVVGVIIWQAITSSGAPDPEGENLNTFSIVMNTAILVFREGLEAVLVLAALTASLVRTGQGYWKPVGIGAGLSFLASIATWFIVVAVISNINAPALDIQAGTGLLAIIVLIVIMNWFFHNIYWTGWISHHNKRIQSIVKVEKPTTQAFRGLMLVGFTSVYREGFEVVLFLQNLRLKAGEAIVLQGVLIGLLLTGMVAVLTFVAHKKLPYLKMLVLTGLLLGVVFIVMVGESVEEMQLAHWVGTTMLPIEMPAWLHTWFVIYPSVESLSAQFFSAFIVIGSYFLAQYLKVGRPAKKK